jgi:hypothetical protein
MDPAALIPLVSPVITAAVAYLRDEAARKAGEKAAETVGTEAGKAIVGIGPKALATVRAWFTKHNDTKAQQALTNVEQDPTDDDYQQKLIKETTRLASTEPAFAQELKILAEQVMIAQPGSTVQTFHNQDTIVGIQGQNTGTVAQQIGSLPHDHERDT